MKKLMIFFAEACECKALFVRVLFFFVWSLIILLMISPDSYLYDLYGKCDSVFFFTDGKAWMNGLIPYQDFSDSKGPLLFLFYGIGYLLSPTDYVGVFWMSCFLYTSTFWLCYRIALIFISDEWGCMAVATLMPIAYFNIMFFGEIRAEDLAAVFVALAMLMTCRCLYEDKAPLVPSFVTGMCIGACFLIKFTFSGMLVVLAAFILWHARKTFWRNVLMMTLGAAIVVMPFMFVFLYEGNLLTFIDEYILKTFVTVSNTNEEPYLLRLWSYFCMNTSMLVGFSSLIACLLIPPFLNRYKYFPLIAFSWFYFVTLQNGIWQYYYASCSIFVIFGIIALLKYLQKKQVRMRKVFYITVPVAFFICVSARAVGYHRWSKPNLFYEDTFNRHEYWTYANLMGQMEKPRIICMNIDWGFGTPAECLPGCRYWYLQTGYTKEMADNQWQAIEARIPDFIMMAEDDSLRRQRVESYNYKAYYVKGSKHVLYSKHHRLIMPDEGYTITTKQLLMKQRPW